MFTIQKIFIFLFLYLPFFVHSQANINVNNIQIMRDTYGVPHIFTETNQEAVYGIAWAQCEDNFNVIQDNFAIAKGHYGEIKGKEGAILDFITQMFELDAYVDSRYRTDITPEIDTFCQVYASAMNRYAELHPTEVKIKGIFPLNPNDILKGYIFNFIIMSNAILDVVKVADNKMDLFMKEENLRGAGSNAMAYNNKITADGKTYLVGNPHQPNEGPACFWELSVHSKEGLDIFGATFAAGGVFPLIGTNRKVGWSSTTNYEDYSDVFELKMSPTQKDYYEYDGKWLKLEKKTAKMKVKMGAITIPISKVYYKSVYGPTLKNKSGYYSFRNNSFFNLKFVEQTYKMALSQNYNDFWNALQLQGMPCQTVTYADYNQTIMHISNGILPKRNPKYAWRGVLAGNTSENNWSYNEKYALEELVYVKNPKCGYVYNCNNTPLECSSADDNPKLEDYPKSFGILTTNTSRSKRFKTLISQYDKINFQQIKAIRDDVGINKSDMDFRNFMNADDLPAILSKYPQLAEVKRIFDKWDGKMNIENKQAALFSIAMLYIGEEVYKHYAIYEYTVPEDVIVASFMKAQQFLLKNYATLEVELGTVQKIVRGGKEYPMYGSPATLASANFKPYGKKKFKAIQGDSYIIYARYGDKGLESLETINVFGNSNKPDSPHFTDQLEMYVKKEVKTVELDLTKIKATSAKYYSPQ